MSMKIPWPEGTTPGEMRRRTAERQEQFRKDEEKRRAEFQAALARKDVRELAPIWHKAVGDACDAYDGPTRLDLEELEQVTFELAIGAEVACKPHRSMGQLRGVLREMIHGSLSNHRSSFAHSQQLTLLRASAALEIDGLLLAHEAALRRGPRSPDSETPQTASTQASPTASERSRIEGEPPLPMASPHSHPSNPTPKTTVPASNDPPELSPSPRPLDQTETWILSVLKQEPTRSFKIKTLKAARRRRDQATCPVERSALCAALARLRTRELVTYVNRSYMHKQ